MTEDHIFPRAISSPGQRQVRQILKRINPKHLGKVKSKLVQNGLVKKTLCGHCNNKILGIDFDPALTHLCNETSLQLRNAKFLIQPCITVNNVLLNKVARAVAGHFIAHDDRPQHRHPLVKALRRYVLDIDSPFPTNLRFQIWLYPFREQALMKDLFHAQLGKGIDPFAISAYKTFPLAFSFNDEIKNPAYNLSGVLDITDHLKGSIESQSRIRFDTRTVVDKNWPFAPLNEGAILTSDNDSITTTPFINTKPYPY